MMGQVAVETYLLSCELRHLKETSLRWYSEKLRAYLRFAECSGAFSLKEMADPELVAEYYRHLRTTLPLRSGRMRRSEHTVAGHDQKLRAFFAYAKDQGWLSEDPMRWVPKVERPATDLDVFSQEEVANMLSVYNPRDGYIEHRNYTILLCLYSTAMVLGELVRLRVDDFDGATFRVRDKNHRVERVLPLNASFIKELESFLSAREKYFMDKAVDEGFLFAKHADGGMLTRDVAYRRVVRPAARKAGIVRVSGSSQTWRHTAAIDFVRHGGRIGVLTNMMGHKDTATTLPYVERAFEVGLLGQKSDHVSAVLSML